MKLYNIQYRDADGELVLKQALANSLKEAVTIFYTVYDKYVDMVSAYEVEDFRPINTSLPTTSGPQEIDGHLVLRYKVDSSIRTESQAQLIIDGLCKDSSYAIGKFVGAKLKRYRDGYAG